MDPYDFGWNDGYYDNGYDNPYDNGTEEWDDYDAGFYDGNQNS
jgi:hypothetical protein